MKQAGPKPKTQADKFRFVKEIPELKEEFNVRVNQNNVKFSKKQIKINGKRTGIHKFDLFQKRIASEIYEEYHLGKFTPTILPQEQEKPQLKLF